MEYLVKKVVKENKTTPKFGDPILRDTVKTLYVADTHTFNLKGKQLVTLTDLREYAQECTLEEATDFVKTHKEFEIEEAYEEVYEDDMEDEENE